MAGSGPEAFTSTTIFMKCGGKVARVAGTLHPEDPIGAAISRIKAKCHGRIRECLSAQRMKIRPQTIRRLNNEVVYSMIYDLQQQLTVFCLCITNETING